MIASTLISSYLSMPVTYTLMLVIFIVSVIGMTNPGIFFKLMLHPYSIVKNGQVYRFITSDLIHNDIAHLILNESIIFFACGSQEKYLNLKTHAGSWLFLLIYWMSGFVGSLIITMRHHRDFEYSSAGASGSAIGGMFSYMVLQPKTIGLYLPIIGGINNMFTALLFIVGFIIYQIRSKNPFINNELHFYSAITGSLLTLITFDRFSI